MEGEGEEGPVREDGVAMVTENPKEDTDDGKGAYGHGHGRSRPNGEDNFIPKRLADYREREYWERRYKQEQSRHYDWLLSYGASLRSLLGLRPTDRVLVLGCGNSRRPPVNCDHP